MDTLAASKSLKKLKDLNFLVQKGGGNGTYYLLDSDAITSRLMKLDEDNAPVGGTPHLLGGTPHLSDSFSIPESIKQRLATIEKYSKHSDITKIIIELCAIKPFQLSDLSKILNRKPRYLREKILSKMIKSGELVYLYPDQTAHPLQAYTIPKK